MHDAFVPLHVALRPVGPLDTQRQDCSEAQSCVLNEESADRHVAATTVDSEPVLAEARRFAAALADGIALSLERLVRDIACEVLARELALAPCDVATIAARALHRYLDEEPVRVRVHPDDIAACSALELAVVADRSLRAGDVVLDVRCGSIDASLGARLETLLS
jgi:hypothetical protein